MAEYKNVIYEKREHVAIITNNNPERLNALSVGLRKDIDDAMMEAANDTDVRAIIWTGAGRAFSAGANMGGRGDEGAGTPDPSLQGLVGNVIAAENYREWGLKWQVAITKPIKIWALFLALFKSYTVLLVTTSSLKSIKEEIISLRFICSGLPLFSASIFELNVV